MEFGVLGPLLVESTKGAVVLGSPKQRALLASLLLHKPGHLVTVEQLIDDLWGEDPPQTGAKALQVQASHLRRALGPEQPIVTRPKGYALDIEASAVDLHRFEARLAQARRRRGDGEPAAALRDLDDALEEWRGAALSDVTLLGRSASEASRLDEMRAVAREERIELQLECGAAAELVPELEALLANDPYREHLYELLMLALYRAGRQVDALETFRHARKRLMDDLGLNPGSELARLEAAVLAHDPALDWRPTPSSRSSPAEPTHFADRSARVARAGPHFGGPLFGREAQLESALALIEDPGARLITLTGAGGIGKTRLASELARRLGDRSRLVELAPVGDPGRVFAVVCAGVGAEEANEAALAAALSDEAPVLFLDNFEHVLGAAPVVASLLRAMSRLTVVVTSRAALHISGERELPVPPLDGTTATELFVERAREQAPDFSAGPEDLEHIAAICARLDGLPLAIELAAARTRVLTPREILGRIGRRLDLLTAGRRDAPERHRTLRATIAWSHDLLGPEEQRLFAWLAVFASGWSLEACEALAEGPVLDELSLLVEHGLVIRDGSRFKMLETVREYALEQLDASPEATDVRRRHALWCLALADGAEQSGPGLVDSFAQLDAEQENLRAAAAWAVNHDEPEIALGLESVLWRFWLARGGGPAAREVLATALATGRGDGTLRAKALNASGVLAGEAGDLDAAEASFLEALDLASRLGDPRQRARTLMNLGVVATYRGDHPAALIRYADAGQIWRELGDARGQSIMCQNQAVAHQMLGQFDPALPLLEESVELARTAGDDIQTAQTLVELAKHLVHQRPGDRRVPALLVEALELATGVGEQRHVIECLEVLAALGAQSGAPVVGAELIGTAEAQREHAAVRRNADERPFFDATVRQLQELLGRERYEQALSRGAVVDIAAATTSGLELANRVELASVGSSQASTDGTG